MQMFSFVTIVFLSLKWSVDAQENDGYFWQISDLHFDPTYGTEDLSCIEEVKGHGIYGDYKCDSPFSLVKESIQAMKRIKADVNYVLWTGDSTPHTIGDRSSVESHLEIILNITSLLKEEFPRKVVPVLGNYDYFPKNQLITTENIFYNQTYEKWVDWMGPYTSSYLKGGYYFKDEGHPFSVVVLNTNLYYKANKQTGDQDDKDPAGQFAWLEEVLLAIRELFAKAMVIGHVPPGVRPDDGETWMYEKYNKRLNGIIAQFADTITMLIFAHEHSDNFRVHQGDKGAVVQFCAPSVSPRKHVFPPNLNIGTANNPSIRLYKYNLTSYDILDYTQYYMDLPGANSKGIAEWKVEYSATEEYDLPNLKSASVQELVSRMENRTSPEFQSFYKHWTVSIDDQLRSDCDGMCHARFYCNFLNVDYDNFSQCFHDMRPSSAPQINEHSKVLSFILVFLFQFLVIP